MKEAFVFDFEGIGSELDLVPLGARRGLDRLGAKLSLEGWRSLSLEDRLLLLRFGADEPADGPVDEGAARQVLERAVPLSRAVSPIAEPTHSRVPASVQAALEPGRSLAGELWAELTAFERWTLTKLAESRNPSRTNAAYDEILAQQHPRLTHLNSRGEAHMVGVTEKAPTLRTATATTRVTLSPEAHRVLLSGDAPKGDVLCVARIAGILAAKQTPQLIPLCHAVHVTAVELTLHPHAEEPYLDVEAQVSAVDRTGVEMEAMVAVSVAALTVYDMLKAIDRSIVIGPTRLLEKRGGKTGEFRA